jgi:glycosyltransferase involved in cell wall biosynthesis
MTKQVVLIMDPRGAIDAGGEDAIERHMSYKTELNYLNSKLDLIISSASINFKKDCSVRELVFLNSYPTFNPYKFARRVKRFIKSNNLEVSLLVVGDPWESAFSAIILNRLLKKKIPIQIQLHGDIAHPAWKKLSLQNRIRFNFAKLSMNKAGGIRAVSNSQALKVAKIFKIEKAKISVIPVPINNLRLLSSIPSKRPRTLGLIGRIHNDRGVDNFIKLVKALTKVRNDFTIVIAGGGPDESRFLEEIKELLPKSKIKFLGHLSEKELKKVWREIGVLVSTAPAESYGRAMREALVAGVPVWATKSSGVEDLISKAGKNTVKILELKKSNRELSRELDQLLKSKVPQSFRKQFIKDNSTYAQLLAKSWIDLINKQKL